MAVGVSATRGVLMPLVKKLMQRRRGSKKATHSLENLAGLTGLFLTLLFALQAASFGDLLTILGTLAAAATVAIGFGMRDQVSSLVAGIFIHTDNPFVKGDYIRVKEVEGKVDEIRLRATKLNTGAGERIVPNNVLTTEVVHNFTRGARTSDTVTAKVPGEKAETATEIFEEAVASEEEVLDRPEPRISYSGLEEDKVEIKAEYWMKDSADIRQVRGRVIHSYSGKAQEQGVYGQEEEE